MSNGGSPVEFTSIAHRNQLASNLLSTSILNNGQCNDVTFPFEQTRNIFAPGFPGNPDMIGNQDDVSLYKDLLLATDPDADRLGVAAKNHRSDYVILTGNQTGVLLLHYVLSQKKEKGMFADNSVMFKTIVTSELGRAIAQDYGVQTVDTLTGFKYIAEKIERWRREETKTFQFGYEESYGYLIGDFARDRDAVQAAVMIAEAAAYYKQQGMTLYDGLIQLYETYSYYKEALTFFTLKGKEGAKQISRIVKQFREHPPAEIADAAVETIEDYQSGKRTDLLTAQQEVIDLPSSNVLKFWLQDGS